jgi:hypothetical protein
MTDQRPIFEADSAEEAPDPDVVPIRDRRLVTQPYDLVVEALVEQIKAETIFLRPLSERPEFQRRYVWTDQLASRLIESVLLNVPIPPCYLSQNEDYELDVIDGQQRLFSIYRFLNNEFHLRGLEVLTEFDGVRFFEMPAKVQRQIKTHTLRCILITNESHPEIRFDVFERLNTNTVPLNAQELRNCIYRGSLNSLLREVVAYEPWLVILKRHEPDRRMRDEELALRYFAFLIGGIDSYRTPQKHWLNSIAKEGRKYSEEKITELRTAWKGAVDISLIWFDHDECFRRFPPDKSKVINRALFDLVMQLASQTSLSRATTIRERLRSRYAALFKNEEFTDLISKSVDHARRTRRRFEIWQEMVVANLG